MTHALFMNNLKTLRLGKRQTWYFPNVLVYSGVKYVDAIVFQHPLQPFLELEDGSFLCSYCAKTYKQLDHWRNTSRKPLSPKFNLPFDKNGDKKFFDPQEGICSQKNGVIDGSWQEFLAQIFPLHCRLIPESFMLMCSKEKKVC